MRERLTNLISGINTISLNNDERTALLDAVTLVLSDDKLLDTAQKYYNDFFQNEFLFGREIEEWNDSYADDILGDSMIFTVVMFARAFSLMQGQTYLYDGKPIDFYTVLLRHYRVNTKIHMCFGIKFAQRFWIYCYLKPVAFELGRLAFEIIDYNYSFEVYQNPLTKATVPIALEGVHFDTHGFPDNNAEFVTTLDHSGNTIYGYTYDTDGHLIPQIRSFTGFERVLKTSDKVLSVHMPGNAKLTDEAVEASLRGAELFFDKYFPNLGYKAFVCSSWLLDTGLKAFLNENSNILKLQKRFRITLAFKNDFSLFDNVFVVKRCPIDELVPKNRFQREILDMIKRGGTLYSGRGYILRNKI